MDLWIRTQDRYALLPIKDAIDSKYVEKSNGEYIFEIYTGNILLGRYNEKRALEIFDEIQRILNLKNMYKYDRELVLKSWENVDKEKVKIVREQMSVYEMPKE